MCEDAPCCGCCGQLDADPNFHNIQSQIDDDQARFLAEAREIREEGKLIKLADLYDNTSSIVEHAPEFAKTYLREKAVVLQGLTGANNELYKLVEKQLWDSLDKLGLS